MTLAEQTNEIVAALESVLGIAFFLQVLVSVVILMQNNFGERTFLAVYIFVIGEFLAFIGIKFYCEPAFTRRFFDSW